MTVFNLPYNALALYAQGCWYQILIIDICLVRRRADGLYGHFRARHGQRKICVYCVMAGFKIYTVVFQVDPLINPIAIQRRGSMRVLERVTDMAEFVLWVTLFKTLLEPSGGIRWGSILFFDVFINYGFLGVYKAVDGFCFLEYVDFHPVEICQLPILPKFTTGGEFEPLNKLFSAEQFIYFFLLLASFLIFLSLLVRVPILIFF